MNTHLSPRLRAHLAALEITPPPTVSDAAQRRLEAALARPRRSAAPRQWIGWMAAAATTCLVLALVMLPTSSGSAFAIAQKHLRDFDTLSLTIEQQSQGIAMPTIHVRMNREGDVRTDLGKATSIVVSPRRQRMLTLLHDSHMAMETTLDATAAQQPTDRLAWLGAIRRFQGQARRLPGRRVIDDRPTSGWALDTEGMHIVLWIDSDGLPRAVEINGGKVLSQRMHVAVDQPFDASVFSTRAPAGYTLMPQDAD